MLVRTILRSCTMIKQCCAPVRQQHQRTAMLYGMRPVLVDALACVRASERMLALVGRVPPLGQMGGNGWARPGACRKIENVAVCVCATDLCVRNLRNKQPKPRRHRGEQRSKQHTQHTARSTKASDLLTNRAVCTSACAAAHSTLIKST